MNKISFLPVFEVGIVDDALPACRQVNTASLDPAIAAGMCVSIIDFMISKIEDHKQIDFEKEVVRLFNEMVENRHDFTSQLGEDDFDIKK